MVESWLLDYGESNRSITLKDNPPLLVGEINGLLYIITPGVDICLFSFSLIYIKITRKVITLKYIMLFHSLSNHSSFCEHWQ